MATVFISHAAADRAVVEAQVIAPLEGRGITTWYSTDDVRTGEDFEVRIREGLRAALALCS